MFVRLGVPDIAIGLDAIVAAIVLHRRTGWSTGGDGISPPAGAASVGEKALDVAVLAAGFLWVLQGVGRVLVAPPGSPLVEAGPRVLQSAAALALTAFGALFGGAGWRLVTEQDA